MMRDRGEVLDRPGLTLGSFYREAVTLPVVRGWPPSDFVYLSEDDYLFRPEAFTSLAQTYREIPETAYVAFYATTAPRGPQPPTSTDTHWRVAETTTSSFGARISTLAADRWLHLLGSRAQDGFDRAICMADAGRRPPAGRRPRLLLTGIPPLATHMEEPHLAQGVDWAEVAADTARWAEDCGIRLAPPEAP